MLVDAVRAAPASHSCRAALRVRLNRRLQPDPVTLTLAGVLTLAGMWALRASWAAAGVFFVLPPALLAVAGRLRRDRLVARTSLDRAALAIVKAEQRFQWESACFGIQAVLLMTVLIVEKLLHPGAWARYLPLGFCIESLGALVVWARRGIRFGRVPGQQGYD